ncbi:hypothetical protein SAMN05421810_11048 [Amycolatopsis arida]|uniref:Uncharacterized protein n=1 Tax=Amycolatopsis arida TaxID=587909 RepID=A0A1I5ZQ77_9PSEU|nr:hypothetical protein [Amycolatopsis arida]TDX89281.1 hypothetical protein CLV69_11048 [Amycolatopsis arida]SFQ58644.1 hypothetical protein SAMN05421810_11048 [Amycolatopsis arida]
MSPLVTAALLIGGFVFAALVLRGLLWWAKAESHPGPAARSAGAGTPSTPAEALRPAAVSARRS